MDVDAATGKVHVLVSAAKMAPLDGSNGSEQDRDHRARYNMASYLWAPDSVHLLFDADGRLWLYDLRNGTGVQIGFTGVVCRRRSEVFAGWFNRLVYPRSQSGRDSAARAGRAHRPAGSGAQSC